MRAEVTFDGAPVGTLDWRADSRGAEVALDCVCCGERILRVFAESGGAGTLYVGLPEPQGGRLRLTRRLSAETLHRAGWEGKTPERVYLAEKPLPRTEPPEPQSAPRVEPPRTEPPRTGDAVLDALIEAGAVSVEPPPVPPVRTTGDEVLDALIEAGAVSVERTENGVCLSCPFSPHEPFALAPAFVLCRAERGRAVLDWKTEGADAASAPSEME